MSGGRITPTVRRRAILRTLGGAGILFALSGCTSGGNPSASPTSGVAGSATVAKPTPILATPASTGTPAGTTTPAPAPAGASPSPAASPTGGRVIGAAAIPIPPPTPGGVPPTPIGVTPLSSAAAPPTTTPGSASGGAVVETGAQTTPVAQNAATGTAVPGSNLANAAPVTTPQTTPTPQPAAKITITADGKFDPAQVTINAGQTITWVNQGRYPQTVTDDPSLAYTNVHAGLPSGAKPWDSGILNFMGTFSHTFTVAGDYTYFSMPFETKGVTGTITVK